MRRFVLLAALAALGGAVTQACSVLLPWDGYVGPEGVEAGAGADANGEATLPDGTVDALPPADASVEAGDADPDGALTPFEVPCGSGLACKNARRCCAYGDGRPWECAGSCPSLDEAGASIHCDSPTDCTPGERCCAELRNGSTLERTFCSIGCPGGNIIRTCDPAFGGRDCVAGSACTRKIDSGLALTFCEGVPDQ